MYIIKEKEKCQIILFVKHLQKKCLMLDFQSKSYGMGKKGNIRYTGAMMKISSP